MRRMICSQKWINTEKKYYEQATENTRKLNDVKDDDSRNSNNSLVGKKLSYLATSTGTVQMILKERENGLIREEEVKGNETNEENVMRKMKQVNTNR